MGGKRLGDYDVIVAMEKGHRDYVLSLCPECGGKVVVWNVRDPYFMDKKTFGKFMNRLERRLQNWLSRSEVPEWAWFGGKVLCFRCGIL